MLEDILAAVGLLLVFEGMFPFLSPGKWRHYVERLLQCDDKTLRGVGLISMLVGAVIFYLIRLLG